MKKIYKITSAGEGVRACVLRNFVIKYWCECISATIHSGYMGDPQFSTAKLFMRYGVQK